MGLDYNHSHIDSVFKYILYFKLLKKKIKQYRVELQHIYNIDKKGFLVGILLKIKRIFSHKCYKEGLIKQLI